MRLLWGARCKILGIASKDARIYRHWQYQINIYLSKKAITAPKINMKLKQMYISFCAVPFRKYP